MTEKVAVIPASDLVDGLNHGIATLNYAPCGSVATIAATGLGRSGTTMISRVMAEIGVDMGQRLSAKSAEDRTLQVAIKANDSEAFEAYCRARDSETSTWGFKVPALRNQMASYASIMRSPRYIVIFRDVLSIALRNKMAVGAELIPSLKAAAQGYQNMIMQICDLNVPVLLISYEKSLQFPENTVKNISLFCGKTLTADQLGDISARVIMNGDPRYIG